MLFRSRDVDIKDIGDFGVIGTSPESKKFRPAGRLGVAMLACQRAASLLVAQRNHGIDANGAAGG